MFMSTMTLRLMYEYRFSFTLSVHSHHGEMHQHVHPMLQHLWCKLWLVIRLIIIYQYKLCKYLSLLDRIVLGSAQTLIYI